MTNVLYGYVPSAILLAWVKAVAETEEVISAKQIPAFFTPDITP